MLGMERAIAVMHTPQQPLIDAVQSQHARRKVRLSRMDKLLP